MKISLGTESGTVYLAGSPSVSEREHTSAADLVIRPDILTQSRDGVRKQVSGERDRGNLKTVVSFSTRRLFATEAAAQEFALDYDRLNGREGTLSLSPMGGGATRTMANCVVRPPERSVFGCTVTLFYTCIGGEIAAS